MHRYSLETFENQALWQKLNSFSKWFLSHVCLPAASKLARREYILPSSDGWTHLDNIDLITIPEITSSEGWKHLDNKDLITIPEIKKW